jgi:molybdenum cofactor cytidylyltransferase
VKVSVLVLAAGRSSRFGTSGEHKLLALLRGAPLVRLSVSAAIDAGIGAVVVVTGAEARRVERALAGLDVRIVHEPGYADGMATSLRRGVRAVSADNDAIAIALGDQPLVRPEAYRRLVHVWQDSGAHIVVPRYAGHDGPAHPVLFAAAVFDELRALSGDSGAREVIVREPSRVATASLEWNGPIDVDTPEDLIRLTDERPPRD